jgi:hypothetical protein
MRTQLFTVLALLVSLGLAEDQLVFPNPDSKMAHHPPDIEITTHTQPSLADLLTIESSASIFYSYARELELSSQFSETAGTKWTLLVPTNRAVMALSRKP